jgi:hypothetical protein
VDKSFFPYLLMYEVIISQSCYMLEVVLTLGLKGEVVVYEYKNLLIYYGFVLLNNRYRVIEAIGGGGTALVEWQLETGRTHQVPHFFGSWIFYAWTNIWKTLCLI